MTPIVLALLCALDILLYTARNYTNKLFAMSYEGPASMTTPIFSSITAFAGFVFSLLFTGKMELPGLTTLLCGIAGGCILFLFDMGNLRAAKTGPYSIQSIICMFGCVALPLLFETLLWDVKLTTLQLLGILSVCVSFVLLNIQGKSAVGIRKGFYGWAAMIFFSNGIYSTLLVAQQRWTGYTQRSEMIAVVFLTMTIVSLLYLRFGCKAKMKTAFRLKKKSWGYALASAASMCAAMNLLLVLIEHISASILYPIQNSVILVIQVLLSALHLREKISTNVYVGVVFALAGIIVLNL